MNIARKRPQRELFLRLSLVGFFPRATVIELPVPKKAALDRMVGLARDVRLGVFELQQRGEHVEVRGRVTQAIRVKRIAVDFH